MTIRASASVLIRDTVGLHARPSVKLTKLAKRFAAQVDLGLSPEGPWIDAKSIVKVMAAKALKDSTIYFRPEGQAAAPGLAVGVLVCLSKSVDGDRAIGTPDEERQALIDALASARTALTGLSAA